MAQEQTSRPHDDATTPVAATAGHDEPARVSGLAPPPLPASTGPEESPPPPTDDAGAAEGRRTAKRRPAGPPRHRVAANDDAPSIGGLIYALNQKPSSRVFVNTAIGSGLWAALALGFGWVMLAAEFERAQTVADVLASPGLLTALATIIAPIGLAWLLALLSWRAEELRLRSSAMTEVAVRLAEPDRMAEQSIASLGQAVRRQVSFMNEAVERALGRAGELEALVHNEVSALDRSYEENERKIRGLIQELAGERHALLSTSERVNETLRAIGSEVPALIDKLSGQQLKLATIIDGAGQNLTALESAIATQTGSLENTLGGRTAELQQVLHDYTAALGTTLGTRSEQLQTVLQQHIQALDSSLDGGAAAIQQSIEQRTLAIESALESRTQTLGQTLDNYTEALDVTIADRTSGLQTVFEEYAKALDTTLANRAQALDAQLVERTTALDNAFTERLKLFDDAIMRSTLAIDNTVGETSRALTAAMDEHARTMSETIGKQAAEFDEALMNGIVSVRRTSENITRQSIKAIEGLAGQADLLKNVSENLLSQVHNVTNRFENQGQTIIRAANALETANYKIDSTLQNRHNELTRTLDRLSGRAEDFGRVLQGYSSTIEGSLSDAEHRTRQLAEELQRSADQKSRATIADIERLKLEAAGQTDRALDELRQRFSTVSREVSDQLGTLTSRFDETSSQMRDRAARAAAELEDEQERLRQQMATLPGTARESTEAMRRALQDQLRALEQLSSLTSREAGRRDVTPPAHPGGLSHQPQVPAGPALGLPAPTRDGRPSGSLSSTLAQELAARPRPPTAASVAQAAAQDPAHESRENWSLGDLLKRASRDEVQPAAATTAAQPLQPAPALQSSPQSPINLNIEGLARAIDGPTASAIWNRFRSGQRGFMVRSIYSEDGRNLFDEVSRRYRGDASFQQTVNRYLVEFESIVRQSEARDQSGHGVQNQLVSDMGRVYLLLAHAAGRLV